MRRLVLPIIIIVLILSATRTLAFCNGSLPELSVFDEQRVMVFLHEYNRLSGSFSAQARSRTLDQRIQVAGLTLADQIEAFRRLAPGSDLTDAREELRMERLILSVEASALAVFKLMLEYDGDYKDIVEYIFHDIDNKRRQERILSHFNSAQTQPRIGIKVLSDADDTLYANLIDRRYPKKTLYPGVLEFYAALGEEPFALAATPITLLSARPNPIAGVLEQNSLSSLVALTRGKLCPSALSGALLSSTIGTAQTLIREALDALSDRVSHRQEDKIGIVKFENFLKYSAVYPEYRYLFLGDSGQADALTAQQMIGSDVFANGGIITTFIHDLRVSTDSTDAVSPSFRKLAADEVVGEHSSSGRGIIVHRNYIDAAVIAYQHAESLGYLISLAELAMITRAALTQLIAIDFQEKLENKNKIARQYRDDAEQAYAFLTATQPLATSLVADVIEIRRLLDEQYAGI